MDGLSLHTTFGAPPSPWPYNYRNPNGDDMAWQIVGAATQATHPSHNRTWNIGLLVCTNILQIGADSTQTPGRYRYGTAGMFPQPLRALSVIIRHNGTPNTQTAPMLLGIGFGGPPAPINLFPGVTRLWIGTLVAVLPIGTTSHSRSPLIVEPLFPALPPGPMPTVFFQAAYLKGTGDMTNANAVSILR